MHGKKIMSFPLLGYLQMLSMEMSRSCSYIDGWLFLLAWALKVDWECSLVTWILISPVPYIEKKVIQAYRNRNPYLCDLNEYLR